MKVLLCWILKKLKGIEHYKRRFDASFKEVE